MLAMVESVDHVTETAKRLPNVPIVALVETARGLERITEIAATKGTFRLAFGIGDFRRDTGFGRTPPPWPTPRPLHHRREGRATSPAPSTVPRWVPAR